jgi:hypothetical protein
MGHSRKDPRGNFCRPRGSGEKFVSDRVLGHPKRCGGGGVNWNDPKRLFGP